MRTNIIMKKVIGAVIFNQGKVLLLRRAKEEEVLPNYWELPSGKQECGESDEDTLRREVFEESGLQVSAGKIVDVFKYKVEEANEIRETTQINYLAFTIDSDQKILLSREHSEARWFNGEEIVKLKDISDETKSTILKSVR